MTMVKMMMMTVMVMMSKRKTNNFTTDVNDDEDDDDDNDNLFDELHLKLSNHKCTPGANGMILKNHLMVQ